MAAYALRRMHPALRLAGLVQVQCTSTSVNRGQRSYPEHPHADHEVLLVLADGYECRIDGRPVTAACGDAVLVQPGDRHADAGGAASHWTSLRFRLLQTAPQQRPFALLRPDAPAGARRLSGAAAALQPLVTAVAEALSAARQTRDLEAAALGSAVVWRLAGMLPHAWLAPQLVRAITGADLLHRLAALAESLGFSRLDVATAARHLGVSVSSLAHQCSAQYGQGPARLLLELRLAEARRLIRAGAGIAEAAAATGFASPAHFTRRYRAWSGRTPSSDVQD